ncbi:hypothetical protein NEAUS05_0809 [Nematocida ausubeli]|nr:hypothetical protein NEAUS05_0809 [Nematocida ausubeli]
MKLYIALWSKRKPVKKLSAHSTRKKITRGNTFPIMLYVLIQILILCQVWGKMSLIELISTHRNTFTFIDEENRKALVIKPDRRMGPFRSELEDTIGLMYNKRFLSPEIKIEYSVKVEQTDYKNPIYTYTRDYSLDRVRDDNDLQYEGDLLKYKKEYFSTLLEMFPSMHGYVSIWSDKTDSFYTFINSKDVKEHKHEILASLFLLSRGVNVRLEIYKSENQTELVLRTADKRNEHFKVSMNALVKTSNKNVKSTDLFEEVLQEKAVAVINFFIENRKKRAFKEEKNYSEEEMHRLYIKRKYVNSPSFLIHTYIYYCLENIKETTSFIKAVYDLLYEYLLYGHMLQEERKVKQIKNYICNKFALFSENIVENTLNGQHGQENEIRHIFERHFLQKDEWWPGVKYIEFNYQEEVPPYYIPIDSFVDLMYLSPLAGIVPFRKNIPSLRVLSSLSANIYVPDDMSVCAGDNTIPLFNFFIDYGETALLGLFRWAFYNRDKNICTADHIESASEELKSFFRKHRHMHGVVSKKLHDEWNQVVGGLSNQKIQYMRSDRNHLTPGFINMLYVIKEITGVGETEKIDKFRKCLDLMDDEKKIREVRMLYSKYLNNTKNTMEEKNVLERNIREIIYEKELNKKKRYENALKHGKKTIDEDNIELEIDRLVDSMKKKEKKSLSELIKSYNEENKVLKDELGNDIKNYLIEVIKKIALYKDFSLEIRVICKQTIIHKCCDVFGKLEVFYNINTENDYFIRKYFSNFNSLPRALARELKKEQPPYPHLNGYKFIIYPKYHDNTTVEIKWKTIFKLYRKYNIFEDLWPLRTNIELCVIEILSFYLYKTLAMSELEIYNKTLFKPDYTRYDVLGYGRCSGYIDTLLVRPEFHGIEYRRNYALRLLLHAKKQKYRKESPFVYLVDNIVGSIIFMDGDFKDAMFLFLSLEFAEQYYPHITIDKHAYKDPACFTYLLTELLKFIDIRASLYEILEFDNIITSILVMLRRNCLKDSYYTKFKEFITKKLDQDGKHLLIRILTQDGDTIKNITKIVQAMQETEKAHPVNWYEKHSNEFLHWIIWGANEFRFASWAFIVKKCYELIDAPEPKEIDFSGHSSNWGVDIDLKQLTAKIRSIVSSQNTALESLKVKITQTLHSLSK